MATGAPPLLGPIPPGGEPAVRQTGIGTAVQKVGGTPNVGTAGATQGAQGIMAVKSLAELTKMAGAMADTEITGQTSPLEAQVPTLQGQETNAINNIGAMFGSILPYAAGAATKLQGAYNDADAAQAGIFQAANQRMNELAQGRAAEAQALAQQMGGPVAVNEFTSSMGYEPQALANLGAGQMLHTLQYGLADVGQANAFAGRVLPLVQTEQTAQARQYYEDKITELQKQIATIKSTKGTLTNSKLADLMVKEREFQLQKTQQALDRTKADRDWKATVRTLKQEDKRIGLSQQQWKLQEAQTTGKYKGKQTQAAVQQKIELRRLTDAEKQQAAALGMSNKEYALKQQKLEQQGVIASQKLAASQAKTWAEYLDAAVSPQAGKSITETHPVPVPRFPAKSGKISGAYVDPSSPTGYSKLVTTVTPAPGTAAIHDPNQLVDYLVSHNVPQQIAENMVKNRLHIQKWKYGQPDPNAPKPKPKPKTKPLPQVPPGAPLTDNPVGLTAPYP